MPKVEAQSDSPKLDQDESLNKDPDEWVGGEDPMTPSQASYLKTLCDQAGDPDQFDDTITKAEASKRIDALREELGLARGQKRGEDK